SGCLIRVTSVQLFDVLHVVDDRVSLYAPASPSFPGVYRRVFLESIDHGTHFGFLTTFQLFVEIAEEITSYFNADSHRSSLSPPLALSILWKRREFFKPLVPSTSLLSNES